MRLEKWRSGPGLADRPGSSCSGWRNGIARYPGTAGMSADPGAGTGGLKWAAWRIEQVVLCAAAKARTGRMAAAASGRAVGYLRAEFCPRAGNPPYGPRRDRKEARP